jgi:hypothetical protein
MVGRLARSSVVALTIVASVAAVEPPSTTRAITRHLGGAADVAPTTGAATISGIVFDSLSGAPLAGADVQFVRDGTPTRVYDVRSDSAGRFIVADAEDGSYLAGFFHPRLDSLGIDIPPSRVAVTAGATVELVLASPSRRTIVSAVCPDGVATDDATLLLGAVRDAATGDRMPGATVSVQWSGLAFQDSALAEVRQGGMVPASPEGRYAVCNLPIDAELTLRAAVGPDTSGAIALQFPPLGILARDVFVAPLISDEANAAARLTGRVTSTTGAPIAEARISVWGDERSVRTNSAGEFTLAQIPGGSTTVDVRAVGYEPARRGIDLRVGATRDNRLDMVLLRAPTTLAPVTVVDTRISGPLLRSGFEQRRTGGVGRFIDAATLDKMQVANTTSALAQLPGMITRSGGRGNRLFMRDPTGRICAPMVWVDGAPFSPAAESDLEAAVDIDLLADPTRIAGIEVYRRATQAPLQYAGTTPSACGVVVIWRKEQ